MAAEKSLSEQLGPIADQIFRHVPRQIPIVQVVGDLAGKDRNNSIHVARNEALRWLQNRSGKLPDHAWAGEDFENPVPGVTSSGVRLRSDEFDFWAARLDYMDRDIAGRTWTTEILVAHVPDRSIARFGVRLTLATRESRPQYAPSVPGIVRQIVDTVGLQRNDRSVIAEPIMASSEEQLDELIYLINDPRRRRPVFVISLGEDESNINTAAINATELATRSLGIAHVYVVPGASTYYLTDSIGKKVFGIPSCGSHVSTRV